MTMQPDKEFRNGAEVRRITLSPGECPEAVDQAEEVLLHHSERLRIFQRAGEVVRIISLRSAKRGCGMHREIGTVQLAPVGQVALMETFDRLINWQRERSTKKGTEAVRIDCPAKIPAAYLSRIGLWRLPQLTGIISAPIMRPDGSVVCRAGYDDVTGLYLTEDWPDLSWCPTREDALVALGVLLAPYTEFPFVAEEDRSALIAGILTAIQRRLLQTAPLFGFTAPTQRTGKTLLAESIATIATGRPAPAMAVSGNKEEMRKAITAALREGHSIINLDNIEHPLGSPDLSRALTQTEYGDRLLGKSSILQLPTNVTWTATGNNLSVRGDMAVRAVFCRLDAKLERPEERQFLIPDVKAYITEHRRELVTAALTILRAYAVAGRPDQGLTTWGGFDEWSLIVRAPLVWLGIVDPCATRRHVLEDDPDRKEAAALLSAWHSTVGTSAVQIADVIDHAAQSKILSRALLAVAAAKSDSGRINSQRLSWWCRKWRDRVVKNYRLEQGKSYGSHDTWRVVIYADTADSADRITSAITAKQVNSDQLGHLEQFPQRENIGNDGNNGKSGSDETSQFFDDFSEERL